MTPDELLQYFPQETLRWLRGKLRLSQEGLAERIGADRKSVAGWETRARTISPIFHRRLAVLIAPYLATAEGAALVQRLRATLVAPDGE